MEETKQKLKEMIARERQMQAEQLRRKALKAESKEAHRRDELKKIVGELEGVSKEAGRLAELDEELLEEVRRFRKELEQSELSEAPR